MTIQHSELQQRVINVAKMSLQTKSWFRGVCIENLPSDEEISVNGVYESAEQLVADTFYYDAPSIFDL